VILGIDVGANGGLALVSPTRELIAGTRMPTMTVRGKTAVDAVAVINWVSLYPRPTRIVIELVSAMKGQGVTSMFQFGRMLGGIECAVQPWQVPIEYITPAVWKKALGLSSDKQASLDAAHTAFGERGRELIRYKADDGIAEAGLLALYSLRT